jgi:uncharacterized protein
MSSSASNQLSLADWRRQTAEMYAAVRRHPDPAKAWHDFRSRRDRLFRCHPQSPLSEAQRAGFSSLSYFPYDPAWRVVGSVDMNVERETFTIDLGVDGEFRYRRIARVRFTVRENSGALSLFWVEGYGGGLFLPFGDAGGDQVTYGGGRYLYDTIKGADLSATMDEFVLDFNYAYNPSCAYNDEWFCPLTPSENRLPFAVPAGERLFRR